MHSDIFETSETILTALKACGRARNYQLARRIHTNVSGSGELNRNHYVANTLIDAYAKCGRMQDALTVFQGMPRHTVVSWNCLIQGYADLGDGASAFQLYREMQDRGFVPSSVTYLALLKSCGKLAEKELESKSACLEKGRVVHSDALRTGDELERYVANSLVYMYVKCGSMDEARSLFERISNRMVVSWTAMIQGYAEYGDGKTALEFYDRMMDDPGCVPDVVVFLGAIKACVCMSETEESKPVDGKMIKPRCLERGKFLHQQVLNHGLEHHTFMPSRLVDMYSKLGCMEDARDVFLGLSRRDLVSWTALILGYVEYEEPELAVHLYEEMIAEGCQPDEVTYVAVLKACGSIAALEKGRRIEAEVCNGGLHRVQVVANSTVDFYGKCGSMEDAQRVFDAMEPKRRSLVTWNALMDGYGRQGDSDQVFHLLEELVSVEHNRFRPNEVTMLCVLSACCHAGLVDRAKEFLTGMVSEYGVTPNEKHFTVMIQLLARAQRLDEAVEIMESMSWQGDAKTWTTLMDACCMWGDFHIGRAVFEDSPKLEGSDYVLLANLYACTEKLNVISDKTELPPLFSKKKNVSQTRVNCPRTKPQPTSPSGPCQ